MNPKDSVLVFCQIILYSFVVEGDFTWWNIIHFLYYHQAGFLWIVSILSWIRSSSSPHTRGNACIISEQKIVHVYFWKPAMECMCWKSPCVSCTLQHNINKKGENFSPKEYFGGFTDQMWEYECIMNDIKSLMWCGFDDIGFHLKASESTW